MKSQPPQTMRSRHVPERWRLSAWRARWVAVGLFVATTALLLSTLTMGYTRDESFYFRYAMQYQEWFEELDAADSDDAVAAVMSRDRVIRTWLGNFEHPPVMKTLFGVSWQVLARKYRNAGQLKMRAGETGPGLVRFRVPLHPADGFAEGASVDVLGPLRRGESLEVPGREIGRGVVVERRAHYGIVEVAQSPLANDLLIQRCANEGILIPAAGGAASVKMTGCQVVEPKALTVMDEATSMRLPAILFSALAVAVTFLLGLELFGWLAGLFGGLGFIFVPRHFFHAHLCSFDMPIVAASMLVLYCFWRARDDRRWALYTGLAWGLALLVKHNAFFMPVPLLLWWAWAGRDRFALSFGSGRRWRVTLPPIPLALLVMPLVAVPVLFAFWPKLWFDPMRAIYDYFNFHLSHEHYMQWYFGQPLQVPPFPMALPFVLTVATIPLAFTGLFGVGLAYLAPLQHIRAWWRGVRARRQPSGLEVAAAFAIINGMVPIILIALPSTPIFGGIKHWMTGMPLLLLVAGYGLQCAVDRLRLPNVVALMGVAALMVQPALASIDAAPFGTGYYNSLVAGGIQGAADKQMMRLYWGHTSLQALDWLNGHAPEDSRVFFQNTTTDAYDMYKRMGLVRADIRYAHGPAGAKIALIEPQKAFAELDIDVRRTLKAAGPVYQVLWRAVPMLNVYTRGGVFLPALGRAQGPKPSASGAAGVPDEPGAGGEPGSGSAGERGSVGKSHSRGKARLRR